MGESNVPHEHVVIVIFKIQYLNFGSVLTCWPISNAGPTWSHTNVKRSKKGELIRFLRISNLE